MKVLGFEFLSKEEREKTRAEFTKVIYPFGEETHKAKVLDVLHEVCTGKERDEELLFVFITSKEIYLKEENDIDRIHKMFLQNKHQRWISEENLRMVATLIYLEADITSPDNYPTADAVRAASQQYPITEFF
jgi:hypothetical protein